MTKQHVLLLPLPTEKESQEEVGQLLSMDLGQE